MKFQRKNFLQIICNNQSNAGFMSKVFMKFNYRVAVMFRIIIKLEIVLLGSQQQLA